MLLSTAVDYLVLCCFVLVEVNAIIEALEGITLYYGHRYLLLYAVERGFDHYGITTMGIYFACIHI